MPSENNQRYIDAATRLYEIRGVNITRVDEASGVIWSRNTEGDLQWAQVPQLDAARCMQMAVEHGCYPDENGTGSIYFPSLVRKYGSQAPCEVIASHHNKMLAVCNAIVLAVVFKLEKEKEAVPV